MSAVLLVEDEPGQIGALDAGADDYVTKPFSMGELLARLRRKLEDNPTRPFHLLTEPGMGYRYRQGSIGEP
jgi:DNA-binding response OmpR family regulator